MIEHKKYYQVLQGGNPVGDFLKKENAILYAKEFNTKVEVSPVEIVEKEFLDDSVESKSEDDFNWGAWETEHDSTSEYGGV